MVADAAFPTPLDAYPPLSSFGLLATLRDRVAIDPFNAVATVVFFLAKMKLVTAGFLWKNGKYAILLAYLIAAIITPQLAT